MLHPSTKRLIDKLSEMTRKQRVVWTEGESGTVVHDTEGYRVILTPEPHAVVLTDVLGREIERCSPDEFQDETDGHGRPYVKFVGELYREAARHARGTERAIRALLAGLDAADSAQPVPAAAAQTLAEAPGAVTDETAPLESESAITAAVASLAEQINATPEDVAAPMAVEMPVIEQPAEPMPASVSEAPDPETDWVPRQPDAIGAVPLAASGVHSPASDEIASPDEPGSFGTFGDFDGGGSPQVVAAIEEPLPVAEEPVARLEDPPQAKPEAAAAPALSQPISLSSIPFGFGLGAAQRVGAPSHPSVTLPAPEPQNETPARRIIDGTVDLPDLPQGAFAEDAAEPYPSPASDPAKRDAAPDKPSPAPEPGPARRFNPWN